MGNDINKIRNCFRKFESNVAVPNYGKDKVWELMKEEGLNIDEIVKVSDEWDLTLESGFTWRVKKKSGEG